MEFDFTGTNPRNPLVTFNPEPGPYECKIASVNTGYNGGKSTQFEMDTIAGPMVGMTISKYIGNDEGEKGGNKSNWLQALMCVAPDPDAFLARAKAGMKFDPATHAKKTFEGKTIHVIVIEVPGVDGQGRNNLPNIEFLTKAQYSQVKAGEGQKKPARAAAPNGTAPAAAGSPAPATPAAGSNVLDDLFAEKPAG